MKAVKICCLLLAAALAGSGCSSHIADTYTIDYDRAQSSDPYALHPAPNGALDRLTSSPYQAPLDQAEARALGLQPQGEFGIKDRSPEALQQADAEHIKEVRDRAYERAREITAWTDTPATPPQTQGMDQRVKEIEDGPYPSNYHPYRVYPFYRPAVLPTYWPSHRPHYRRSGIGAGVGIWIH